MIAVVVEVLVQALERKLGKQRQAREQQKWAVIEVAMDWSAGD